MKKSEFLRLLANDKGIRPDVRFEYSRKNGWCFYIGEDNGPYIIRSDFKWTVYAIGSGFLDFLKNTK